MSEDRTKQLVPIHQLWQTDRASALALLAKFHAQLSGYKPDEMVDMAHLEKRMDRQNGTNGGGAETSVWTSITVRVANGEVTEGRLSELYPHGVAVPTYDAPRGRLSQELIDADYSQMVDPDNKQNVHKVDTAYNGKSWRDVVAGFLGQAMEVAPNSPAPDGFVLVPIKHQQPPMTADGAYTDLDLYWRSHQHGTALNNESLKQVATHILGSSCVMANEHLDEPNDVLPFVLNDPNYQHEIAQLEALMK